MRLRPIFVFMCLILVGIQQPFSTADTAFGVKSDGPWLRPIRNGHVIVSFSMTDQYGPGHRGIDLAAMPGQAVHAVAAGTVVWAGNVAGRPTISVEHRGVKSTYEPVRTSVRIGDSVAQGEILGTVQAGHDSCAQTCLHLGRIESGTYLDPEALFLNDGHRRGAFRLISPLGAPPAPPIAGNLGEGVPVAGLVSSGYGMRIHPISKVRKFHNGIDIQAPCGRRVVSVGSGSVRIAQMRGGYGQYVEIGHPNGTKTAYAHLSSINVSVGESVQRGDRIGSVGNTGASTGCHLHFIVKKGQRTIDPRRYLH